MTNEAKQNEDTVKPLVGRCLVFDGKGWGKEGTVLVCAPCRREKEEPWFFFDEPRFPWRVRDLKREGFFIRANPSHHAPPLGGGSVDGVVGSLNMEET